MHWLLVSAILEKQSMDHHEVKEDIHKQVLLFPFPHQSMLDTPGKQQKTLVSLNIVQVVQMTQREPQSVPILFPKIVA